MIVARSKSFRRTVEVFALGLSLAACGDLDANSQANPNGTTTAKADGAPLLAGGPVDVLFVVDDSLSMGDKQAYLAEAAEGFLNRLVNPSCVDDRHHVVGASIGGACATGSLEFEPVGDLHVGIVSTSMGDGDPDDDGTCASLRGELQADALHPDDTTADANGVFVWNAGSDLGRLVGDVQHTILSLGEHGCGFESQLESWYRFLVQPDPYDHLEHDPQSPGSVIEVGVDQRLLAQRKAFLRPDSTVAVVLLTDENDSSLDPLAIAGTSYQLFQPTFVPPAPTSACATDPESESCTSCAFDPTDSACAGGASQGESPNVAMFHAKQRFGVDPQFPISRYVTGLTKPHVPGRDGEHPPDPLTGRASDSYVGVAECDNPLFVSSLADPAAGDDLCHRHAGVRSPGQIFFLAIAGLPYQLVQQDPTNPASPMKATLDDADYRKLLGADPLAYDFDGADVHMLESLEPRAGISAGDPIVLGDVETKGEFLERACTFPLATPLSPDGSYADVCTATSDGDLPNDPVCATDGSHDELYAFATPGIREIALTRALGHQGVVASICPAITATVQETTQSGAATILTNESHEALFGYEPATMGLVNRMSGQ